MTGVDVFLEPGHPALEHLTITRWTDEPGGRWDCDQHPEVCARLCASSPGVLVDELLGPVDGPHQTSGSYLYLGFI